MKFYELTYLISQKLAIEEAKKFSEEITSFVRERGTLVEEKNPIKRKLSYPIKKEGQGYLASLTFYSEPEKLEDLTKKLDLESQVLRYIILTKKMPEKQKVSKKLPKIGKLETFVPSSDRVKPKKEKVELEEIEKKLEEILGEQI